MQRARKDEDKEKRRAVILEVAAGLFDEAGAGFTMDQLAARAGLAKGTLYLYFRTKEHVLLALLERELGGWFDDVEARLAARSRLRASGWIAGMLAGSVVDRPRLAPLLALLSGVLEHNIDREAAQPFKRWLRDRLVRAGAALEARVPRLAKGQGVRIFLHLHVAVVGLWELAHPAKVVEELIAGDPDLAIFAIDFEGELWGATSALLSGMGQHVKGDR